MSMRVGGVVEASPRARTAPGRTAPGRTAPGRTAPGRTAPGRRWRGLRRRVSVAATLSSTSTMKFDSVEALRAAVCATEVGRRMKEEEELRTKGIGQPDTDAPLRTFGKLKTGEEPRVVFYRDMAAWCPYCQKVWLLLEEKKIPYKLSKVPMRSYGDKPSWFLDKVPNGLLPAIELDGDIMTESLVIMQVLDTEFTAADSSPALIPQPGSDAFVVANNLLRLERKLFSAWCEWLFRPSGGGLGGMFGAPSARDRFESVLDEVNSELGKNPMSPWFLPGYPGPSLVDMQYISHVERMIASIMYWKGVQIRGTKRWSHLEKWLQAFEERPCYQATRSDYYSTIKNIPPQYGPAFEEKTMEAKKARAMIDGEGHSWKFPLHLEERTIEPLAKYECETSEEASRHEAAYKIINNFDAIVTFACRGAGERGRKRFGAELADPYALPNDKYKKSVALALQSVVESLYSGTAKLMNEGGEEERKLLAEIVDALKEQNLSSSSLALCLCYLRDRVGVPRDMSFPSAMMFRAHLNQLIDVL